jgi:hypothetical protein
VSLPIASVELSRRLMRVNIAYTIARMKVIEARSGQPVGIRRFGDTVALLARQVPSPHVNTWSGCARGRSISSASSMTLLAGAREARGGGLIPLVRQHRQRMKLDAFVVQFLGVLR